METEVRPKLLFLDDVRESVLGSPHYKSLESMGRFDIEIIDDSGVALDRVDTLEVEPAIVFVDLVWNRDNNIGMDILRSIRARRPHLPLVVFSGKFVKDDVATFLEAGADAILVKTASKDRSSMEARNLVARFVDGCRAGGVACRHRHVERLFLRTHPRARNVFVSLPFTNDDVVQGVRARAGTVLHRLGYYAYDARDDTLAGSIRENVEALMHCASRVVAILDAPRGGDVWEPNANVLYELGAAHALGLPVMLLKHPDSRELPAVLQGRLWDAIPTHDVSELDDVIERWLRYGR